MEIVLNISILNPYPLTGASYGNYIHSQNIHMGRGIMVFDAIFNNNSVIEYPEKTTDLPQVTDKLIT